MSPKTPSRGFRPAVAQSLARRARRRRLIRWTIYGAVIIAVAIVAALLVTGRTIVPVVSERLFPIQYVDEIEEAAALYDLDPYLVAAVVKTESGYDPSAVSSAGAVGLMQLMPETADWIVSLRTWRGPRQPDLTDPAQNVLLGACYLDYLSEMFEGNAVLTLAAYNAGQGVVSDWVLAAGGESAFGLADIRYGETRSFVQKVEHYRDVYSRSHPDAFSSG